MKLSIPLFLLTLSFTVMAQSPNADQILDRVDANMSSENQIVESRMIIHGRRNDRTISSRSWIVGSQKSFTEYLAPAREKGTKMLKLAKKLWLYAPSTDRTIQISGHMLRQSLMGSDLSYEDMMDDRKLRENYQATVVGVDSVIGRPCWKLELVSTVRDNAYYKRLIWVDQVWNVPLKQDLFAKSGKLLKRLTFDKVKQIDGRWYPTRMVFKDMLKTGKGTEFVVDHIQFNQNIPQSRFSKARLRR